MNLKNLIKSTQAFKPVLFSHADSIGVDHIDISRHEGENTVLIKGVTRDSSGSSAAREVQVHFTMPDERNVIDNPPSFTKDQCRVNSSSPGYKFHFQYPNHDNHAHYGQIRPFTVSGKGRPVNPSRMPGLDKHLISFVNALTKNNILED